MKKVLFSALIASSLIACQTATKPAFDLETAKQEMNKLVEAVNIIMKLNFIFITIFFMIINFSYNNTIFLVFLADLFFLVLVLFLILLY